MIEVFPVMVVTGVRARFIPASAGNVPPRYLLACGRPVHPRERGERVLESLGGRDQIGSSPRARGTSVECRRVPMHRRFIPASAGNVSGVTGRSGASPVHPRERGERDPIGKYPGIDPGSSPRARGTLGHRPEPHDLGRFIPASAGNVPVEPNVNTSGSVHPRERGERRQLARP